MFRFLHVFFGAVQDENSNRFVSIFAAFSLVQKLVFVFLLQDFQNVPEHPFRRRRRRWRFTATFSRFFSVLFSSLLYHSFSCFFFLLLLLLFATTATTTTNAAAPFRDASSFPFPYPHLAPLSKPAQRAHLRTLCIVFNNIHQRPHNHVAVLVTQILILSRVSLFARQGNAGHFRMLPFRHRGEASKKKKRETKLTSVLEKGKREKETIKPRERTNE